LFALTDGRVRFDKDSHRINVQPEKAAEEEAAAAGN
jgi:hypothetical protein